jgi:16S rRNA G1207 methylase RsmC
MKVSKSIAILCLLFLPSSNLSKAQSSNDTTQVDELKSLVMSQQKTLEHQQAQIEALQQALEEQKEMLASALQKDGTNSTEIVSAVYYPSAETSIATKPQAPQNPPLSG